MMLHAPPLIGHTILPRLADHPTWALFANITTILVFLYNQPKHKLAHMGLEDSSNRKKILLMPNFRKLQDDSKYVSQALEVPELGVRKRPF